MKKLLALMLGGAFILTGCVCPHGPHDGGRSGDGSQVAAAAAPHLAPGHGRPGPSGARPDHRGPDGNAQAHGNGRPDGARGHQGKHPEHHQGSQDKASPLCERA